MLTLAKLAGAVAGVLAQGGPRDIEIRGIHYNSRRIEPGFLFVAVPGLRTDGHLYVQEAFRRGAVAVVVQKDVPLPPEVAWLKVEDSRRALADLAACYYGYPSRRLRLFGVTGTNGKTTTTYLIQEILQQAGCPAGLVGTIANRLGSRVWPAEHTTPESLDLQALLAEMLEAGARAVSMEVSSHALALDRVRGTEFDVAVFTNLTQDHLDFHPDMESYFASKAKLFEELGRGYKGGLKYGVVNADDPWAERLIPLVKVPVVTYGLGPQAVIRGEGLRMDRSGSSLVVVGPGFRIPLRLRLLGQFNVYNALAAWAVAWQEGLDLHQVADALGRVTGAPGRFERVEKGQDFAVIVDYAHTPDGLENALRAARQLTEGRLIVVFGCGGDRDRKKRPLMGEAAARWSDYCIITSDNPRSEEPEDIIAEIEPGVRRVRTQNYEIEVDRRRAIARALGMAEPGDTVVIAGKGHENYQLVKGQVLPFDDRKVAAEELERLGYRERV
ncbi:MAG: UDP-N-acetylmuramoyl-L-alanyl-D-glutamate--2,6-diaminopimelate ligase [Thermoanaerobacteraceae bacterium]|nr:UDP-N-acetylmuramoyl-L-alanyl-D-glutamate--2,6-diaminopimelate ligase [Thermoanaerobacteraceae bacterium]